MNDVCNIANQVFHGEHAVTCQRDVDASIGEFVHELSLAGVVIDERGIVVYRPEGVHVTKWAFRFVGSGAPPAVNFGAP